MPPRPTAAGPAPEGTAPDGLRAARLSSGLSDAAPPRPVEPAFAAPPAPGTWTQAAPGLLWARLPLPFRLDHVNVYAIEDPAGWVLIDTGIADDATKAAWDALLPRLGPVQSLLVTHHHPDHIGLAGWLCDRLHVPLWTSRTAFLLATTFVHTPGLLEADEYARFYAAHGLPPETAQAVISQGHRYLQRLSVPPRSFRQLKAGDTLHLGHRHWQILSGEGHAPEQLMLHAPEDNLLLAADQVIERITPNVSVLAFEPDGDPLGDYLASLSALHSQTAPGTLTLSGHRLPFTGLHARIAQLRAHHDARCAAILHACADGPRTVHDLLPILFPQKMDPHETGFAVSEALAHVNHMAGQGTLVWETDGPLRRVRRP